MNVSYYTLGCKLNQAETDELKNALEKVKFLTVPFDSGEEISIIRACGVTCGASQTTREMIRRVKRRGAVVVATGCLENNAMPEIDFVGKNNEEIIEHLLNLSTDSTTQIKRQNSNKEIQNKTRKFIKIQTGCNFQCSYCIIPQFRGKSNSMSPQEIITKINQTTKNGFQEVVLTGVNICQYKYNAINLVLLLKEILDKTSMPRIRLGSLDPRLITDELVELYGKNKNRLLPHWHLSLQSGSDTVLKRMARGYSAKKYAGIVKKLRLKYPLFSITTDIIVGFPGETEEEFLQTCKFVKQNNFCKVHVFPFSPRPGTQAAKLKPIHNQTITDRAKKLNIICKQVAQKYTDNFVDQTREVLFENKKGKYWYGYSPEYFKIKFDSDKNLENVIKNIKITGKTIC